eukprot:31063-Pelagococcus_subviridis.AAC.7
MAARSPSPPRARSPTSSPPASASASDDLRAVEALTIELAAAVAARDALRAIATASSAEAEMARADADAWRARCEAARAETLTTRAMTREANDRCARRDADLETLARRLREMRSEAYAVTAVRSSDLAATRSDAFDAFAHHERGVDANVDAFALEDEERAYLRSLLVSRAAAEAEVVSTRATLETERATRRAIELERDAAREAARIAAAVAEDATRRRAESEKETVAVMATMHEEMATLRVARANAAAATEAAAATAEERKRRAAAKSTSRANASPKTMEKNVQPASVSSVHEAGRHVDAMRASVDAYARERERAARGSGVGRDGPIAPSAAPSAATAAAAAEAGVGTSKTPGARRDADEDDEFTAMVRRLGYTGAVSPLRPLPLAAALAAASGVSPGPSAAAAAASASSSRNEIHRDDGGKGTPRAENSAEAAPRRRPAPAYPSLDVIASAY